MLPVDIDKQLKSLGIGRTCKVGKRIGGFLYVHRDFIRLCDADYEWVLALSKMLPINFQYDIVKIGKDSVSFIACPEFHLLDEPRVGESYKVDNAGKVHYRKPGKRAQVYHQKYLMVPDSFSHEAWELNTAKKRAIEWKSVIGKNRDISSKIGYEDYWLQFIAQYGPFTSQITDPE